MPNNVTTSSPVNVNYDSRIERVDEETILDAIFKRLRDIENKVEAIQKELINTDITMTDNDMVLSTVVYKALNMHTQLEEKTKREVASSVALLMRPDDDIE